MFNLENKVADELCFGNLPLNPQKWFQEEVNGLALRMAGLDALPISAVLPLAQLSAKGPSDEQALVRSTGLDSATIEACLAALGEYGFVRECSAGYMATDKGNKAFRAIGKNMIMRKRLEMKSMYEHLDRLYKGVAAAAWHNSP